MKSLFSNTKRSKPTWEGLKARASDGAGLRPSRTINLSTPVVSVQDGPRMTLANLGGKKATPFRSGGKRRAKVLAAKKAIGKAKGHDLSNIDLAFNPLEKRDDLGRWVRGGKLAKALDSAPAGSTFHVSGVKGVDGRANDRVYTKNFGGTFDGHVKQHDGSFLPIGRHNKSQVMAHVGFATKAHVLTPDDQRQEKDRLMVKRDMAAMAAKAARNGTTPPKPTRADKRIDRQVKALMKRTGMTEREALRLIISGSAAGVD